MKVTSSFVLGALLLAATSTGCASMQSAMRADPPEITGFLPEKNLLQQQTAQFPFHYFYAQPDLRHYKNIYVAPVNTENLMENSIWGDISASVAQEIQYGIDDIAQFMRDEYIAALKEKQAETKLQVVDDPNLPDTLLLFPAITRIEPTKAELSYVGLALSIFVFPGFRLITTPLASGDISVECVVLDGKTKQPVMMYADREKDVRAFLNFSSFTWYSSSKVNIEMLARKNALFFTTDQYDTIERDSPIQFWSW